MKDAEARVRRHNNVPTRVHRHLKQVLHERAQNVGSKLSMRLSSSMIPFYIVPYEVEKVSIYNKNKCRLLTVNNLP